MFSSKDPKIPLYAVDIKVCKDENYSVPTGFSRDKEQGKYIQNQCYESSVPIWGSSDPDIVPKSFNPDIYFYRTSRVSHFLSSDQYKIVLPFYGCYADFKAPQETESYYLLPTPLLNIEKKLTASKKLIKISDEMASIRRINNKDEVKQLLLRHHVQKKAFSSSQCQPIDSSKLQIVQ